jgi:hypothetical protein
MTETTNDTSLPTIGYIADDEAWYAAAVNEVSTDDRYKDVFTVGSYYHDGSCEWEFTIVEVDLGLYGTAMRVQVFDDGYAAFVQIGYFFEALYIRTGSDGDLTRSDYVELFERFGFEDRTVRVGPYGEEGTR